MPKIAYESPPPSTLLPGNDLHIGGHPGANYPHRGQGHDRGKQADHQQRLAALGARALNLPFSAGSVAISFLIGSLRPLDVPEDVMCAVERTITNAESNASYG